MGCCNSNIRKQNYSEVLMEERVIQTGERQLFFSSRQFSEVLKVIESLPHLDSESYVMLCESFAVQVSSPSGAFLLGLTEKNMMTTGMLKNLAVLLCLNDPKAKISYLMSYSKDNLIATIKDLIQISIDVIPNNLESLEKSALLYANSLKAISSEYVKELQTLTLSQIQELLKDFAISSKDIRIKMYFELKSSSFNNGLGDKLDKFRADTEGRDYESGKEESLQFKSADQSLGHECIENFNGNHLGLKNADEPAKNDLVFIENSEETTEHLKKNKNPREDTKNELEINEEIEISHNRAQLFRERTEVPIVPDAEESIDIQVEVEIESINQKSEELKINPDEVEVKQEIEANPVEIEIKPEESIDINPEIDPVNLADGPKEIQIKPFPQEFNDIETKKLGLNSPSVSTPATNLNDDLDSQKSPQDLPEEFKSETSKQDEPQSNPFPLSVEVQIKSDPPSGPPSDLSSPRLAPRKSSGLAAKLKATQAFIKSGQLNRAETSPELNSSSQGDGQAFTKRRVKQEPFTCERKSLTSPKSAFEATKERGFGEEKKE